MDIPKVEPLDLNDRFCLESDSRKRIDARELKKDIDLAQTNKEYLENLQRNDRALREKAAERRKKGGPKIIYNYNK